MLSFLLDQQISPEVAEQIRAKRPEISVVSIYTWRDGEFVGIIDARILHAALEESLTLITYDRRTIPPVLKEWGIAGIDHGGVIFVDNRTIASNDFGRLVRVRGNNDFRPAYRSEFILRGDAMFPSLQTRMLSDVIGLACSLSRKSTCMQDLRRYLLDK